MYVPVLTVDTSAGGAGQGGAGGSCALDPGGATPVSTQHQPHQLAAALPVFSTSGAAGQGGAGGSCALLGRVSGKNI